MNHQEKEGWNITTLLEWMVQEQERKLLSQDFKFRTKSATGKESNSSNSFKVFLKYNPNLDSTYKYQFENDSYSKGTDCELKSKKNQKSKPSIY